MRDIARAVGMLPGSLYCHFATKEDLLAAVYIKGVEQISLAVQTVIDRHSDPWQRLEAACVAHLESILHDDDYAQVVIRVRPADVALVNLEGPAPDDFRYHPTGFVFTFDPALLTGLRDAGIDVVSLANNHIRNAGASGIRDTIRHLDALGILHAGAGQDSTEAHRPAWLSAGI